jgi:hypothetical protein
MSGVNFTLDAAKRIAAVVRKIEQTSSSLNGASNPSLTPGMGFWAAIMGCDISGTFWDWTAVSPCLPNLSSSASINGITTGTWQFADPYVYGFGNAREANGNKGFDPGTVVWMQFVGYGIAQPFDGTIITGTVTLAGGTPAQVAGADGSVPFYVFSYACQPAPIGVPPHDHRDNSGPNGGFAFSTFAPGTSLPQNNFSV